MNNISSIKKLSQRSGTVYPYGQILSVQYLNKDIVGYYVKKEKNEQKHLAVFILTGVLAGFFNGFFGGGGGMIIVPMLIYLLKYPVKNAHATALLFILPLAIVSGLFYSLFGYFELNITLPCLIGVSGGGIIGTFLLKKLSNKYLVIVFSVLMALAGGKLLLF